MDPGLSRAVWPRSNTGAGPGRCVRATPYIPQRGVVMGHVGTTGGVGPHGEADGGTLAG